MAAIEVLRDTSVDIVNERGPITIISGDQGPAGFNGADGGSASAGAETALASASTVNLGVVGSERVLLTGSVVTNTITMGANQRRRVRVQDGWMCSVPGVLVRWIPPGSVIVLESDGAGTVRVVQRSLAIGNVSHIEADDPWSAMLFKPSIFANWAAKPWLDDGWIYSNASGNRSYYDSKGVLRYAGVNEPAFDTIWNTGERGLQYFGARTNLALRSSDIATSPWASNAAPTITADAGMAPDGTMTADRIDTGPSIYSGVYQIITAVNASVYAHSVYYRYLSGNPNVRIGDNGAAVVNIQTGAIVSGNARLIDAMPGGWFRFESVSAATSTYFVPVTYSENATTTSLLVWGCQLELGNIASPYIATAGSQVTRAADVLYRDLPASIVNQNEMTAYVRGAWRHSVAAGVTEVIAAIGNSAAAFGDDVYMARGDTAMVLYPPVSPVNVNSAVAITPKSAKVAARLKANDTKLYANNNAGGQDTSCAVPANINRFTLGRAPWAGGGVEMNGNIMETAIWSRGLPDASLQTIST
ncbi:MAG TPA: hypothetical protein PL193_07555 [Xanthobacteraceae bacterium]|nr:hypothetical protein [Xanthobacteraceae bacterium]